MISRGKKYFLTKGNLFVGSIMKKITFLKKGAIATIAILLLSLNAMAWELHPDDFPQHLAWEKIGTFNFSTLNSSLAFSPDSGDFVLATGTGNHVIYFLDHNSTTKRWQQKKFIADKSDTYGPVHVAYGLGHFVIFGLGDNTTVWTSSDNGNTWSEHPILGLHFAKSAYYPGVGVGFTKTAFSPTMGVATGPQGAVITTKDGENWTQTVAQSDSDPFVPKTVSYEPISCHKNGKADYGFVLRNEVPKSKYYPGIPDLRLNRYGLLLLDVGINPLISTDGVTWTTPENLPPYAVSENQFLSFNQKVAAAEEGNYFFASFHDNKITQHDFSPLSDDSDSFSYILTSGCPNTDNKPPSKSDDALNLEVNDFTIHNDYFIGTSMGGTAEIAASVIAKRDASGHFSLFSIDLIPDSDMDTVTIDGSFESGFAAIGEMGECFYAPASLVTKNAK